MYTLKLKNIRKINHTIWPLTETTVPGVLLTYSGGGSVFNGSVTTVPSDVSDTSIVWSRNGSTIKYYGHQIVAYGQPDPVPSYSVTWTLVFGPTTVNYLMSTPDRLDGSGSTDAISLSPNVYVQSFGETVYIYNYPNLPWATNSDQENDGKHVTFKINGNYIKASSGSFKSGNTVEVVIYIGPNNVNGSYNSSGNYKMTLAPFQIPVGSSPILCDISYIS